LAIKSDDELVSKLILINHYLLISDHKKPCESMIAILETKNDSIKLHFILDSFDDGIHESKEMYISEKLEISLNDCIWFDCTTNMEVNRSNQKIGSTYSKKLVHISGQGTCNPKIDIYDFDSNLDWTDEFIYSDILDYNSSYDDVLIVNNID
jgi:hypothetical protein